MNNNLATVEELIKSNVINININGVCTATPGIVLGRNTSRISIGGISLPLEEHYNGAVVRIIPPTRKLEKKFPKLMFARKTFSNSILAHQRGDYMLYMHPDFVSTDYGMVKISCIGPRPKLISGKLHEITSSFMFPEINEALHIIPSNVKVKYQIDDQSYFELAFTGREFQFCTNK